MVYDQSGICIIVHSGVKAPEESVEVSVQHVRLQSVWIDSVQDSRDSLCGGSGLQETAHTGYHIPIAFELDFGDEERIAVGLIDGDNQLRGGFARNGRGIVVVDSGIERRTRAWLWTRTNCTPS